MSLINKMLKDLEIRKDASGRVERPIFQDLRATHHERHPGRGWWMAALLLAVLGGAGIYLWSPWGDDLSRLAGRPLPVIAQSPAVSAAQETPAPSAPAQIQENKPAAVVTVQAAPASIPVVPQVQESKPAAPIAAMPPKKPARPKPVITPAVKPIPEESKTAEAGPGLMEKTERPYTAAEQAENTYQEAVRFNAQGNAIEAERRLNTLLAAQPTHVKARELLVSIYLSNGKVPEAQASLEQGMAQVPAQLGFRYQLARLYLERGDEVRAVNLLEEAHRQGHNDPELPAFLAALYQRVGRHAEAVKSYQAALAARPQEGRWWVGLGISLEAQQDSNAARDAYRRALDTGRLTASLARYAEDRLKALVGR